MLDDSKRQQLYDARKQCTIDVLAQIATRAITLAKSIEIYIG